MLRKTGSSVCLRIHPVQASRAVEVAAVEAAGVEAEAAAVLRPAEVASRRLLPRRIRAESMQRAAVSAFQAG